METFESQPEFDGTKQVVNDIDLVTSLLREISVLFGFEIDEGQLENEAARLAGYLRECSNSGNPTDIITAIREYYGLILRNGQSYPCTGIALSRN